jgi:hypothetical protein
MFVVFYCECEQQGAAQGNAVAKNNMPEERDGFVRFYHAGADPEKGYWSQVPSDGPFDGFFALATGWGSYGIGGDYFADIQEEKILSNFTLNYEIPYKEVLAAFEKVTGFKEDSDGFDVVWTAVIEDKAYVQPDDLADALMKSDWADASWLAQKMRGQVARALGFSAVEMDDENGTSYLLVPGVPLTRALSANEQETTATIPTTQGASQ